MILHVWLPSQLLDQLDRLELPLHILSCVHKSLTKNELTGYNNLRISSVTT